MYLGSFGMKLTHTGINFLTNSRLDLYCSSPVQPEKLGQLHLKRDGASDVVEQGVLCGVDCGCLLFRPEDKAYMEDEDGVDGEEDDAGEDDN